MMEKVEIRELLRNTLRKCIIPTSVVGSSGRLIENYIDCRRITTSAPYVKWIGTLLYEEIMHFDVHCIGGMELGAVPLITAVCYTASLRGHLLQSFIVRKKPKGHGTKKQIEGVYWKGARVVIVDDVITTGASVYKAIQTVEEAGMTVEGVVVLVDREAQKCVPENYRIRFIFSLSEILK